MGDVAGVVAVMLLVVAGWLFLLHDHDARWPGALRTAWRALQRKAPPACHKAQGRAVPPRTSVRPIEDVTADLQRLAPRFYAYGRGTKFAKVEGCRRAYDALLEEASTMFNEVTLLGVLKPGTDLDRERDRVETRLYDLGLAIEPGHLRY